MKTINDLDFQLDSQDYEFDYQNNLTKKLDSYSSDFNQNMINEIVLWKVNRYSELSIETLSLLNQIGNEFNRELTRKVVKALINENGIQLPMASTILRFKNPELYQIIDQRVYRVIYGKELKINQYKSDTNIEKQIDLYLQYLIDLKTKSSNLRIPFRLADRILYNADKRLNKNEKLNNY